MTTEILQQGLLDEPGRYLIILFFGKKDGKEGMTLHISVREYRTFTPHVETDFRNVKSTREVTL